MRFVALDVGEVRVGVAVCDALETAAFPVGTVTRVGILKRDVESVAVVVAEQEADAVVVGLPLSLDGDVGPQAKRVQGFGRALAQAIDLPVAYWDESLSSVQADEEMILLGFSREKRRAQIDRRAAAKILDSFLAHRRLTGAARDVLNLENLPPTPGA